MSKYLKIVKIAEMQGNEDLENMAINNAMLSGELFDKLSDDQKEEARNKLRLVVKTAQNLNYNTKNYCVLTYASEQDRSTILELDYKFDGEVFRVTDKHKENDEWYLKVETL